ncbi:MAG TPA: DUF6174 domain-containing protein [Myxococcota bacterium]|nr:DUF6174 domain-containing protein [Myxococcota bacterium]HRY94676.1 DUF6174 domain-containing protein [Myxococcota bacterium]HSA22089.1 DUF6174 domain-containing protein [Myxococcota bacterium]
MQESVIRSPKILARALRAALGAWLLLALVGCGDSPERDLLEQSRDLWHSQAPTGYRYDFTWNCFCEPGFTGPVVVHVQAGAVTSVTYQADGAAADPTDYRTIEGLFELIGDAIDRDAHEVRVTYDATRGYPTSAYLDYEEFAVDEEMGFSASNLTAE